jgi:hypothetical protein
LKPNGADWGIKTYTTKAGDKTWNLSEIQLTFTDNTVDMKWWYGLKPGAMGNIEKQTFICEAIPYTFDEAKVQVVVHPGSNPCLSAINDKFPKIMRLPEPYVLPLVEESGNIRFSLARGAVNIELIPIDSPLANIPSGENGLAPANPPARRAAGNSIASPASTVAPVTSVGPDATVSSETSATPKNSGAAVNTKADSGNTTTTTTKSAASQLSSIFVSLGALVLAGLFL